MKIVKQNYWKIIEWIRFKIACFCSAVNNSHCLIKDSWSSVSSVQFSTAKNCARDKSKASQILCKDGIVGSIFLRYQEEIVDCGRPERTDNFYSYQFLAKRKSVILWRTSNMMKYSLVACDCHNYSGIYRCKIVMIIV